METLCVGMPNSPLPIPELLQYYKDLEERVLWIDTTIDMGLLEYGKQILTWNRDDSDKDIPVEKRKPIKILIYSRNGDIDVTQSFGAICKMSKTPIVTVNMGVATGAGLLVLMFGHKRYTMPNAYVHVRTEDTHIADFLEGCNKNGDFNSVISRNIYAIEQVGLGFVDYIVTSIDEIM